MIVNNSSFSAKVDVPNYSVSDNNVQANKSEPKPKSISAPPYKSAKTAFNQLASYKDMLTRSAPLMSDEAFIEKAKEQARKDFANNEFQGEELGALYRAFVSVISPDRVGMMEKAMRSGSSSTLKRAPYLWEILLQLEKGSKNTPSMLGNALPVSSIGFKPDGSIFEVTICDSAGNNIMFYQHDKGWNAIWTTEEFERGKIMLYAYNDAWKQAKSEITAFEQTPYNLGVGTYEKLA